MKKALVLTLGHNSSAIYIVDGKIVAGYEEERLSGIKSDSAFPGKAIKEIRTQFNVNVFDAVYIGHWFTAGELVESKYYDFERVLKLVGGKSENIFSIIPFEFTHHDSHIEAAEVFAKAYGLDAYKGSSTVGLVIDGFGTFGENLTLYRYVNGVRKVAFRSFGHGNSLGLMFQYATAYLGMKMNNHEYKMLGYEAHIHEVLDEKGITWLNKMVDVESASRMVKLQYRITDQDTDQLFNAEALNLTQKALYKTLDTVANGFVDIVAGDEFKLRVIISYYIQAVLESVVKQLINGFQGSEKFDNIILSGGTFYNVKLNAMIAKMVPGTVSVYPLAGDQGAGLGVYNYFEKDLEWPNHLYFGHRNFTSTDIAKFDLYNNQAISRISVINRYNMPVEDVVKLIVEEITLHGFVNLISNDMEFGPRALCQTSTIGLPKPEIVEIINKLNDRTFVMPMAPFMTQQQFETISKTEIDKYAGSLEFMVTACEYKDNVLHNIDGAVHTYSEDLKTFRPQIVKDHFLSQILNCLGPLINTSFNNHGKPIVFSADDIIECHEYMVSNMAKANIINIPTIVLV